MAKVSELQLQHQSPSSEYSGLISLRIDWFDLSVQGTLKNLLQHHNMGHHEALPYALRTPERGPPPYSLGHIGRFVRSTLVLGWGLQGRKAWLWLGLPPWSGVELLVAPHQTLSPALGWCVQGKACQDKGIVRSTPTALSAAVTSTVSWDSLCPHFP